MSPKSDASDMDSGKKGSRVFSVARCDAAPSLECAGLAYTGVSRFVVKRQPQLAVAIVEGAA